MRRQYTSPADALTCLELRAGPGQDGGRRLGPLVEPTEPAEPTEPTPPPHRRGGLGCTGRAGGGGNGPGGGSFGGRCGLVGDSAVTGDPAALDPAATDPAALDAATGPVPAPTAAASGKKSQAAASGPVRTVKNTSNPSGIFDRSPSRTGSGSLHAAPTKRTGTCPKYFRAREQSVPRIDRPRQAAHKSSPLSGSRPTAFPSQPHEC